jgi:hypothetical protein
MSHAERAYKARREQKQRILVEREKQGVLTDEIKARLAKDILQLLNGKRHPKSLERIKDGLVEFLGWPKEQIDGPDPWVWTVLTEMAWDHQIGSRGLLTEAYAIEFWKRDW